MPNYAAHSQHANTSNPEYSTDAGCHRKARPIFVIGPQGRILRGYWVALDDEEKQRMYSEKFVQPPLDPQEIIWPAPEYPVDPDGRGVSWMEWEQMMKAREKAA